MESNRTILCDRHGRCTKSADDRRDRWSHSERNVTESRIYLDNAATSWPKPESVYQAMDDYARQNGSAAGRGSHRLCMDALRIVDQTREQLRSLVKARPEDAVVFCCNGTDALNHCLHGSIKPGDHVITTACEHNSVLRPLRQLESQQDVRVSIVPCDAEGNLSLATLSKCMQDNPQLVVVNHASNVTGTIQPLDEVAAIVGPSHAMLMVDVAQTIGAVPLDLTLLPIDMIAFSGHKSLLGPLGTGAAIIRQQAIPHVNAWRLGGTGTTSSRDQQPESGVEKYESGNLNVPGICGLSAGLTYVSEQGANYLAQKRVLTDRLLSQFAEIPGLDVYGPPLGVARTAVVSFNIAGLESHDLAMLLEQHAGIQLRAGIHCAPHIHQAMGTASRGGTVRASLGPFTTAEDIDALLDAVRHLVTSVT